jgi:arylsulfatase A-like enzyme
MQKKPNVILLTIDTLRADVLGCYGQAKALSPNIDRLAASGILFDQAITGGSWTQAAFPAMLTSTYPGLFGGCLGRLSPERPSPVDTLAAHGYVTAGFSTNPHLSRTTGYDRGFHHFSDLVPDETDPRLRGLKGGQRLLRSPLFHALAKGMGRNMRPARLYRSASDVTGQLCHWAEHAKQPFFAWAHYMDMHWPYHLEEDLTHPAEIARSWQDLAVMNGRSNYKRDGALTTAQQRRFMSLYEASLRYLDGHIGRLLERLTDLGCDDNTVIIIVADHGEEFLEHDRWGHWESNLFDEILRVPLVVWIPGLRQAAAIRRQVRLLDLMPTVLDLCGCPVPPELMGSSLVPLFTGREDQYQGDVALSEMRRDPWHRIAVRTEAFKLIWDNKCPEQPALYDLQQDPRETHDVSASHPEVVRQLRAAVDEHLRRVADTAPSTQVDEPDHDEAVTTRLRNLGYLE